VTRAAALAAGALLLAACGPDHAPASESLPDRAILTRAPQNPMALAVAPNGNVYFIERTGELRLLDARTGAVTTALVLTVDAGHEGGLLGLALDPAFATNGFLYLYFSAPLVEPLPSSGPPGLNVLARYTAAPDGSVDRLSRHDLLIVPSERQCCHEGGSLAFGPDGTLFLGTGDNTNPFASAGMAPLDGRTGRETFDARRTAANPFDLRGKILRLTADGGVPAGNLFPPSGELGRPEIYAMGVRNPFRLAIDATDGRLFFGDIGPDAAEDSPAGPRGHDEIDLATAPGDFGWPRCIADNRPYADVDFATGSIGAPFDCAGLVPSVLAYDYFTETERALGTASPREGVFTGRAALAGAVYRAPASAAHAFPDLDGALLMLDWTRDVVAVVRADGPGALAAPVERLFETTAFRRPIDLDVGPDGALYLLEYGSGYWGDNADAAISRIEPGPRYSPVAEIVASRTHGATPLEVRLDATRSRALGAGETLTDFAWDLDGDGAPDARGREVTHRFETAGTHVVSLVVTSSTGAKSHPVAETIIAGNAPPRVRMLFPDPGVVLSAGVPVILQGEGSDPEDGAAPCEELRWTISLGHNAHAHPDLTLTGCAPTFTPALGAHAGSGPGERLFYAIELSYTDHGGPGGEAALTARHGRTVDVAR
jgi:cytochrome c